ncbi:hypothetical protein NQ318_009723 [Aromia moschata]|uniref:Uncharacterized protein n=1 Tax=Aromia moschata TaxID=1265417 RepID=A0AAV8Y2T7_9CUCU|nr:hypothetical protein NQ318_009723 [Aromia moschata]
MKKDKCNADKMAESGFIFIGNKSEPDAVKCFFCNKGLDGWDPTDDPWQEHIKHSPKCSFAKLQKSQDNMKMKEFLAIKDELMEKIIESYIEDKANKIGEFENYEKIIMSKINKS